MAKTTKMQVSRKHQEACYSAHGLSNGSRKLGVQMTTTELCTPGGAEPSELHHRDEAATPPGMLRGEMPSLTWLRISACRPLPLWLLFQHLGQRPPRLRRRGVPLRAIRCLQPLGHCAIELGGLGAARRLRGQGLGEAEGGRHRVRMRVAEGRQLQGEHL
eukprot:CAMPEP_0203884050 /NCGR_PEP_ID=MMETSP0359-20131031/28117_1 /ASSEMBLY_ACC=CAM_ASM_000338 /TAXON_ID=268821 /ORGANISM="Scrippsiella Hangoei, Strain SHTV-5" /LENGTH=159 /DNA_ID=CAMNT_0050804419 /DNA_START=70 /DNA_END=549 /DNA_ORIENTATION=-